MLGIDFHQLFDMFDHFIVAVKRFLRTRTLIVGKQKCSNPLMTQEKNNYEKCWVEPKMMEKNVQITF